VCASCDPAAGFDEDPERIPPSAEPLYAELVLRIGNRVAMRPCDDPEAWDWRKWLASAS
jgi:hypothetical protein